MARQDREKRRGGDETRSVARINVFPPGGKYGNIAKISFRHGVARHVGILRLSRPNGEPVFPNK